jgi:hypothetical protein
LFDQPVKPVHRLGNPTPQQQSKGVWSYHLASGKPVNPMDERIESFLADVLALEGEDENAVRDGVRVALADYEQIFRAQEVNKRMKEGGTRLPRAVSLSCSRGNLAAERNTAGRPLKTCAQRYRGAAIPTNG